MELLVPQPKLTLRKMDLPLSRVEPEYTLGDVDASGSVDIADLRMVLRSVCGKATLTADQKLAADVEKDDAVNIQDLRKLLRFVCRKIDKL